MEFAGKWKELENIILNEVTQTQKDKHDVTRKKGGEDKCETLVGNNQGMQLQADAGLFEAWKVYHQEIFIKYIKKIL
ncbi:hypothetical protein STEG23_036043, partial [Scotinomys teguina]